MARKQREHQEFGSDSFLDVVANIVGILIVLVVCAGVRAERGPSSNVVAHLTEQVLETQPPVEVVVATSAPEIEPDPVPILIEEPPLPELPELPPIPEVTTPSQLVQTAEQLQQQNEALAAQLHQLERQTEVIAESRNFRSTDSEQLKTALSAKVQAIKATRTYVRSLQSSSDQRRSELSSLQRSLETVEPEAGPVLKLTHRLPPIGRIVTGNEVHFRLLNNRVSHVPIKELAEDVQRDIERRKEILLNRPFFQGTTSPVNGYVMEYILQRMQLSLADELKHGRGMVRIGVSGWVIKPEYGVVTESAEEALTPGSRFLRAIEKEGPTATVTFWVYPDSFGIHRALKNAIQAEGLWVASRPLPDGVPIAGSPDGSKSHAQ